MSTSTSSDVAHGESDDPRTSFRVDTLPRDIPTALRDYAAKVRGGDPGGLPAVLGLVVIGFLFIVTTPLFDAPVNIANLISQTSYIAIIALGLVFVLLLGEIDLSAGVTGGVAAGFAAQSLRSGDLHATVGNWVWTGLLLLFVITAGLAIWKRLWVIAGLSAIGALMVLTGVPEKSVWLAFAFAALIGVAIGVINGVLITALGIPSFIVTLALFLAWQGVTLDAVKATSIGTSGYGPWFNLTHGNLSPLWGWVLFILLAGGYAAVSASRQRLRARAGVSHDRPELVGLRIAVVVVGGALLVWWLNQDRNPNPSAEIKGVPYAAAIPIVFMVIFTIVLSRTTWGRHLYAIGGNAEAATRAGIPVERVKITAFVLCSTMAAIGGLFLADFSGGAQPALGAGNTLLYAVAAAVIGGTSLFGGRGKPRDALIGAFVIAMIPNGIQLHPGLPISVVQEITGAVLLVAASVDAISRRRSRRG